MQQLILPTIPIGATAINGLTSVWRDELRWTYYLGCYPIYTHPSGDRQQFRFITSQLIESNSCRQIDIINIFGVTKSSVARSLRKLRNEGAPSFFKQRVGHRSGKVFSPEVLKKAQKLLNNGWHRSDAAKELGIKSDTFRKAIYDGRLYEIEKNSVTQKPTTKSARDKVDAEAAKNMGTACVNTIERSLAAFGLSEGAPVEFLPSADVPMGGVLCALPALLLNGLLDGSEQILGQLKGYYRTTHILLLIAYMALCRIKTSEQLRSYSPGELGNLLGLDRVPEVRCLREKMADLSKDGHAEVWAAHLSKRWLAEDPDAAGTLYIDGHVRVYHGGLTKPPKRFVSRDRLCLRGTTDYWVNDAIGRPFFVVEKPIDSGLRKALREDIVPRLLRDVPSQPTSQKFAANPYLCRFVLVFDREGYSPELMDEMWKQHRIACITYKKFCGKDNDWPIEMFSDVEVSMPNGETVTIALAEQGSLIGSGKKKIWVREIRKLTDSGHQTSLISTAYDIPHDAIAARMFSRWCQENFFRYMMRHYALDLIAEYGADDYPDTEKVVNPTRRDLVKVRNSINGKLKNRRAKFTALNLSPEPEKGLAKHKQWEKKKAMLLEEIEHLGHQLEDIKEKLKDMPTHITWVELEENDKFQRLRPERKQFLDTVRMVAYRAETAMAAQLKSKTVDTPAARQILLDLFSTQADIIPEKENKLLLIRVHGASRPVVNRVLEDLFVTLNKTEMLYPGTDLQLRYELGVNVG